jgi:hypothetical protein
MTYTYRLDFSFFTSKLPDRARDEAMNDSIAINIESDDLTTRVDTSGSGGGGSGKIDRRESSVFE